MRGRIILLGGKGGDFQEMRHNPLFGLWRLTLELSWHMGACHLSCWGVTIVCTETVYHGNMSVYVCIHVRWSEAKVLQSCPTLCDSMEFPDQDTAVGSLSLLQGTCPNQRLNLGLLHCRQILYQLSHKGSPGIYIYVLYMCVRVCVCVCTPREHFMQRWAQ